MYANSRADDYYAEPSGHRHSPRVEPQYYQSNFDDGARFTDRFEDMAIGTHHHSSQSEDYGKRGTSHHVDGIGSDYLSTQSGHDGTRGTHHHKDDEEAPHSKSVRQQAGGRKELRERLFKQALQPFNKHSGTPYPCTQADIDFHLKSFKSRNRGPFVKNWDATKEVLWQNDEARPVPPAEIAAINRLLDAANSATDGVVLGPDFAIKAFSDLDLLFFGGRLRGYVTVKWKANEYFRKNRHQKGTWALTEGQCTSSEKGQCRIVLNATMIFKEAWTKQTPNPSESMIGTLLHEMCHAYESVRSPNDLEPHGGHGKLFGTRIGAVDKRAMRILGLWAIETWEPHRQHHIFVPYCVEGEVDRDSEYYGSSSHGGGSRTGASETHKSSDESGRRGKPDDGGKLDSSRKNGGSSKRPTRGHKGTDCVIM